MIHSRAKVFFWLYLCAIVYLSLYPWEFRLHAKMNGLYWIPIAGRRQVMDAVLNLFFYLPLGAAGFLSIRRGWSGWLFITIGGGLLSWLIEWVQLWSATRFGNLTDLAANTAGVAVGASVAYKATQVNWYPQSVARWRLTSTGTLLLSVWMLWQMFPFIPALSLRRIVELSSLMSPWSWRTAVEALLGFAVLRVALGRSPWLWAAYAALPAQMFLLDHSLSPAAIVGAGLGWAGAELAGANAFAWLGLILPTWLIVEELRPFSLAPEASSFAWAPFQSWYEVSSGAYYPVIFGKLFLYLAVIWGLRGRRVNWAWAVGIPAVILAVGEWLQRSIPGRTPESTDVVLLLVAAVLLALCSRPAKTA